MKARLLTTLAALLLALTSWAKGVEIKGIYYVLDSSTKTAMVTYSSDSPFYPNPDATAYKGNITIPASVTYGGTAYRVTKIGNYAFYGCSSLTSVSIPSSVTTIGDGAFNKCKGLASISIPNRVTSIGNEAFFWCFGLKRVSIPASVTKIGNYAFCGCTGLTSISIPSSVTKIGEDAFRGGSSLTDIYARHTDPKAYHCSDYAFSDVPFSTCTLHVPTGSKEAYANTEAWSKFKNIVEAAAQTARHPVQSRTHKQKGARKGGSNTKKSK